MSDDQDSMMDKETAREHVKSDFVDAMEMVGGHDMEPEHLRSMIDNIINRYEQYQNSDEDIGEYL